jgi:hypothetical protein
MPNTDSWKTYHPISAAIHAHLHVNPHIELHVTCSATRSFYMRLDEAALSSSHLHTHCYTVFYHFSRRDTSSEFHTFKTFVVQTKRLTPLSLNICGTDGAAHYVPGPLNLQFKEDDTLPMLEELIFGEHCYDHYELNAAHCTAWVRTMDWGRLRALESGHATPQHLIPVLTGKTRSKDAADGILAKCVWAEGKMEFTGGSGRRDEVSRRD